MKQVSIPVIAIGGITQENVSTLAGSGICGIAVISAIYAAARYQKSSTRSENCYGRNGEGMIQKEVMQENLTQKDIIRKGGIPETEICGAIFDLDGVLLDSMAVWNDLGVRYLQKRGIQPEAGLSQILFSMSMEQGADYLKEQYQLPDTSQEILNGIEQMIQDFYFYEVQPKEGAKELCTFCRIKM